MPSPTIPPRYFAGSSHIPPLEEKKPGSASSVASSPAGSASGKAGQEQSSAEGSKNAGRSNSGDNSRIAALARRRLELLELKTVTPSHTRRHSWPSVFIPKDVEDEPSDMHPSEELRQLEEACTGNLDSIRPIDWHIQLTDISTLKLEAGSKVFLGSGGTGTVYELKLPHSDKPFAFKQILDTKSLPSDIKESAEEKYLFKSALESMKSEAEKEEHRLHRLERALQRLPRRIERNALLLNTRKKISHEYSYHVAFNYIPQVPKVYGLFELDDGLGFLMEKISGPNLHRLQPFSQVMAAQKVISADEYLQVSLRSIADILIALGEMHRRELTHCDVKPENVMWDDTGSIFKLMDYGGGRQTGEIAGTFTPGYGQLSGSGRRPISRAHPRTDLYQTGQTLHYLLTGGAAGIHPREFKDGSSIKFIPVLRGLNDTQKNQLAELLNGMVAPEMEDQDQDLRKSAKELLENPLFNNLANRKAIGKTIRDVNEWVGGGLIE